MTLTGDTIAVTTLSAAHVRHLARRDIAHAWELSITHSTPQELDSPFKIEIASLNQEER